MKGLWCCEASHRARRSAARARGAAGILRIARLSDVSTHGACADHAASTSALHANKARTTRGPSWPAVFATHRTHHRANAEIAIARRHARGPFAAVVGRAITGVVEHHAHGAAIGRRLRNVRSVGHISPRRNVHGHHGYVADLLHILRSCVGTVVSTVCGLRSATSSEHTGERIERRKKAIFHWYFSAILKMNQSEQTRTMPVWCQENSTIRSFAKFCNSSCAHKIALAATTNGALEAAQPSRIHIVSELIRFFREHHCNL